MLPKVNCGKILCSCNFPDGEGERKYLLGEIDRPLAAGFQAHVHPRDNIGTLGWRERGFLSGNIPGGRLYNQWNHISSTSDQLLFHSHTSLRTIFHPDFRLLPPDARVEKTGKLLNFGSSLLVQLGFNTR